MVSDISLSARCHSQTKRVPQRSRRHPLARRVRGQRLIVRRLIGTSFDSSGAELICTRFFLTFCDRGAIGLLPPFDLCCANINHLWCLRENAPRSGSRAPSASTILSWSTGTPAPDRVATRAGPIDWFLSRQPPVTNIHVSPCLPCHMVIGNSCNGDTADGTLISCQGAKRLPVPTAP